MQARKPTSKKTPVASRAEQLTAKHLGGSDLWALPCSLLFLNVAGGESLPQLVFRYALPPVPSPARQFQKSRLWLVAILILKWDLGLSRYVLYMGRSAESNGLVKAGFKAKRPAGKWELQVAGAAMGLRSSHRQQTDKNPTLITEIAKQGSAWGRGGLFPLSLSTRIQWTPPGIELRREWFAHRQRNPRQSYSRVTLRLE